MVVAVGVVVYGGCDCGGVDESGGVFEDNGGGGGGDGGGGGGDAPMSQSRLFSSHTQSESH